MFCIVIPWPSETLCSSANPWHAQNALMAIRGSSLCWPRLYFLSAPFASSNVEKAEGCFVCSVRLRCWTNACFVHLSVCWVVDASFSLIYIMSSSLWTSALRNDGKMGGIVTIHETESSQSAVFISFVSGSLSQFPMHSLLCRAGNRSCINGVGLKQVYDL